MKATSLIKPKGIMQRRKWNYLLKYRLLFQGYLYGRCFVALTDHAALQWLLNLKDPSSRLTCWALRLSELDYTVLHKPGRKHLNVDALSRHVNAVAIPLASKHDVLREQLHDKFCQQQNKILVMLPK